MNKCCKSLFGDIDKLSFLNSMSCLIAVTGAGGFGASLVLIHIYVKPMKRLLQALFSVGLAGGLYLMITQV